jgi:hypothetical protein
MPVSGRAADILRLVLKIGRRDSLTFGALSD